MMIAYVSADVAGQIYERLGYGMFVIAMTVGIGVAVALAFRPKK